MTGNQHTSRPSAGQEDLRLSEKVNKLRLNNDDAKPRTALVLFASETGTSEDAAYSLGRLFERLRFDVEVKPMDAVELAEILKPLFIVFTVSTTGQGDIPCNGIKLWKSLLRKKLPLGCLGSVAFTTFGFGDSSYVKFNWAARKLHKRLEQLGAREVYGRGEADEQHEEGTDGAFLPWSRDLKTYILKEHPLPSGVEPIPDDQFLQPKFVLNADERAAEITADESHISNVHVPPTEAAGVLEPASFSSSNFKESPQAQAQAPASIQSQTPPIDSEDADIPPPLILPHPTHLLTLHSKTRLTPEKHFQDVRHLTFTSCHHISYQPGDILTIYPKNFPRDVSTLVASQGWEGFADAPLDVVLNPYYDEREQSPEDGKDVESGTEGTLDTALPQPLTLRNLLLHTLDISAIPSRHFLELCAHFSSSPDHKHRLQEFSDPRFSDEYYDYCTRPRRSILEVLQDFDSVKIPWKYMLAVFPRIRWRQFSIASGGEMKHPSNSNPTSHQDAESQIDILVALVKYRTVLRKVREGLCSRYLSSLPLGTQIGVTIQNASWDITQHNYAMIRKPLLCVGPGTGVAPIRSLFLERAAVLGLPSTPSQPVIAQEEPTNEPKPSVEKEGQAKAKAVLIYGGRNKSADFFYSHEWEGLGVQCLTAWSRDQREKIYVQDIIRSHPSLVWSCVGPAGVLSCPRPTIATTQVVSVGTVDGTVKAHAVVSGGNEAENVGEKERELQPIVGGGGTFFICGSSGKMPIAVRAALLDALVSCGMKREDAEMHLKGMEKSNRYLQETW